MGGYRPYKWYPAPDAVYMTEGGVMICERPLEPDDDENEEEDNDDFV